MLRKTIVLTCYAQTLFVFLLPSRLLLSALEYAPDPPRNAGHGLRIMRYMRYMIHHRRLGLSPDPEGNVMLFYFILSQDDTR